MCCGCYYYLAHFCNVRRSCRVQKRRKRWRKETNTAESDRKEIGKKERGERNRCVLGGFRKIPNTVPLPGTSTCWYGTDSMYIEHTRYYYYVNVTIPAQ